MAGVGQPGYRWRDDRGVLREIVWVSDGCFCSVGINTHTFQWRVQYHDTPVCNILLGGNATPLGLSEVAIFQNLSEPPTRRAIKGLKGMTSYMRRLIRGSAAILESYVGKDSLSFLTVTVPELSQEQLYKCWYHWQDMIDELKQYLAYHAEKKGVEKFLCVYCTEVQPKRLAASGNPYPHLHMVYTGRPSSKRAWTRTPKQVRGQWLRILRNYIGIIPGNQPCENLQRIRKSCARYLAKYLSKKHNSLPLDFGTDSQLTRGIHWGGVSRILLGWFRASTTKLSGQGDDRSALLFLERLPVARDAGVLWYYRGIIEVARNPLNGDTLGIPYYVGFFRSFSIPRANDPVTVVRASIESRLSLIFGSHS